MSSKIRVFGKTHNRTALGIVNAYLIIYPETTLEQIRVIFPNSINPISAEKEMFVDVTKVSDPTKLEGYFTRGEELLTMGDGKKVAMQSQWPLESLQRLIEKGKTYGIEVADYQPADNAIGCKGGYYLEFLDNWKPASAIAAAAATAGAAGAATIATGTMAATPSAQTNSAQTNSSIQANSSTSTISTHSTSSTTSTTSPVETDLDSDSLFDNNSPSKDTDITMATSTYDDSNLNWLWVLIGLVVAGLFVWAIYNSCEAQKLYDNMDDSELVAQLQPGQATVEALPLEISEGQSQDGTAVVDPLQSQSAAAVTEAAQAQVDPQAYMARFTQLQHQFNGIEYKNAKAVLSDSAKHVLNNVAALMEEYPSLDLRIEGHTSSVGRANYNLKLSQQRAQAVATYLEGKGIAADRLVAVGMGEAKPVDPANPNGSDNRVTCLFNISHNEARAQKAALGDIVAQDVSEEGPITADF